MMTDKSLTRLAVLIVVNGVAGCGNPGAPTPAASSPPSVAAQPNPGPLVVFTDPLTGLSTSDVRDAHGHVVQFTTANELIWIDGTHLPGHHVNGPGHPLGSAPVAPEASCQCWLVVRFGATDGQRQAYMTADVGHSNPGTIVGLEIAGSALVVSWTDLFPPGTYTLSGVVTEATAAGLVPLENVEVWRVDEEQGGWDHNTTDKNGFYQLHGLSDGSRRASFSKLGYQTIELSDVRVHGDTRFDVQLSRR